MINKEGHREKKKQKSWILLFLLDIKFLRSMTMVHKLVGLTNLGIEKCYFNFKSRIYVQNKLLCFLMLKDRPIYSSRVISQDDISLDYDSGIDSITTPSSVFEFQKAERGL